MTARSTLVLGALGALGFALVLLLRSFGTATPAIAAPSRVMQSAPVRNADVGAPDPAPVADAPTKTPKATTPVDADALSAVGQANGAIHFEKKPAERDGKGESIDINVRSAVGVWQPDGGVMRVLLLESAPAADNVDRMLGAIKSGETQGLARRSAVLELRFVPTAQAFDRNELDSATLIVSDGAVTSTADALSSLDWHGSLPSAGLPPDQQPTFTLNSSNETVSSTREIWKQSWKLSLTVPVITRR
ncbi:MAG: hypothetical protein WDO68_05025 [Gammaproteobacteria bacterium]